MMMMCVSSLVAQHDYCTDHTTITKHSKPSFDVDVTELERTYKAMQRRLHPDKFSTANPKERAHSEDQAALVNQAYSTLRTPLARARYLVWSVRMKLGAPLLFFYYAAMVVFSHHNSHIVHTHIVYTHIVHTHIVHTHTLHTHTLHTHTVYSWNGRAWPPRRG